MKWMFACVALLLPWMAGAATATGAFAPDVEGFAGQPLIASDGRLLQAPNGARLRRLAENRWMRVGGASTPQQWFDDEGALLAQHAGYIEYRARWEPPAGLTGEPLWHAFLADADGREQGYGVVDARGQVRLPARQGTGRWEPLALADRAVWHSTDGTTLISDLQGHELLRVDAGTLRWVDGPYPGRDLLVLCDEAPGGTCEVRDGAGEAAFKGEIDALLPTDDGGWWLRERDVWQRVDARGTPMGPQRYHQHGAAWLSRGSSQGAARYPLKVDRYATGTMDDTPEPGWLLADGRFVGLPGVGAREVVDYCPGRWLLRDEAGSGWIIDGRARVMARADGLGFNVHPQQPGWRLRSASAEHGAAVLGCDGQVVFEHAGVSAYRAVADGVIGELQGEHGARLWVDAQLRPRLLREGLRLQSEFIAPPLLVAADAQGAYHLYNSDRGQMVAEAFGHPDVLTSQLMVFLTDAGRGLMNADGRVLLPARYAQLGVFSPTRVWSRLDHAGNAVEFTLHDLDTGVHVQRHSSFAAAAAIPERDGGQFLPGHVALNLGTVTVQGGLYFVQQWLDPQGRTVLSAVRCPEPGDSLMAQGSAVLIGPDWRLHSDPGKPCTLPQPLVQLLAGEQVPVH